MSRIRPLFPALFLLAAVLLVAVVLFRAPPPPRSDDEFRIDPRQGELLGGWMNPGGAGPYRLEGGEIRETFGVFRYLGPEGHISIELHHRDAVAAPARRTERFALRPVGPDAPGELLAVLEARLREREAGYRWIEASGPAPPGAAVVRRLPALQLPIAWFLLAQAPLWLALAGRRATRLFAELPRWARLAVFGAIAAAAVARWVIAPLRLVMLYVGYQLTAQASTLQPIPRYGAGVSAFHHVLLQTFGVDHAVILRAHSVLGVALIPLVAALAHAIYRRPRVTVAAAFMWALVPAFIAHDDSEAITVPVLFFAVAALVLLGEAIAEASPVALTGAASLLGLAMIGRPELPLLAPLAAIAVIAAVPDARRRASLPHLAPLAISLAVLIAPHAAHVVESASLLRSQDSLPMGRYAGSFLRVGVLDPRLYPVALVPLALLAALPLRVPREGQGASPGWRSLLLLGVAAAHFGLTLVDLDSANILRVQVPGALFYALAAAAGADRALGLVDEARRLPALAAGASLLALSAVPCMGAAFQRTNEDEEEAFVRAARATLPIGDQLLVRLGYGDIEGSHSGSPVHLYFPDYLFSPPRGPKLVRDIIEWERDPTHADAYFYLGVRCFTPERPFDVGPGRQTPPVVPMRAACRRIMDKYSGETILEREVRSHGDPVDTGYYGSDTTRPLPLALIRLKASPLDRASVR